VILHFLSISKKNYPLLLKKSEIRVIFVNHASGKSFEKKGRGNRLLVFAPDYFEGIIIKRFNAFSKP